MKNKKVKELLYEIRGSIVEEIGEMDRMEGNTAKEFVKDAPSFSYGYLRGLSEAAMILLEKIYAMYPEEKEQERAYD